MIDIRKIIGGLLLGGAAVTAVDLSSMYEEGRSRYAAQVVYDDLAPVSKSMPMQGVMQSAPPEVWTVNRVEETEAPAAVSYYIDEDRITELEEKLSAAQDVIEAGRKQLSESLIKQKQLAEALSDAGKKMQELAARTPDKKEPAKTQGNVGKQTSTPQRSAARVVAPSQPVTRQSTFVPGASVVPKGSPTMYAPVWWSTVEQPVYPGSYGYQQATSANCFGGT